MVKHFAPPNTAPDIAQLADRCVQCGLCLPHCPTYQLDGTEAESPRGRIAYIKAISTGLIEPTDIGDTHLDHCLGCRRCESACPANVEYGALLGLAREQQYLRKPPPYLQKLVHGVLDKPRLLGIAGLLGRAGGYLPGLPEKAVLPTQPALGSHQKIAIFTGCIANTYEASTRLSLQRVLHALGFSVATIEQQTCCGTAAHHLGDSQTANRLAEKNRAAFSDNITVLSLASGCHEQLARSLQSQNNVVDALDFIFQHAAKLKFKNANKRIALHIPCSQSTVVKSDNATRRLLAMIPELDIHELPDHGCCGAAGLQMLSEPERAVRLRAPLSAKIHAAKVSELLSANIGCRLHIANGLKIPVRHPIDFLAEYLDERTSL